MFLTIRAGNGRTLTDGASSQLPRLNKPLGTVTSGRRGAGEGRAAPGSPPCPRDVRPGAATLRTPRPGFKPGCPKTCLEGGPLPGHLAVGKGARRAALQPPHFRVFQSFKAPYPQGGQEAPRGPPSLSPLSPIPSVLSPCGDAPRTGATGKSPGCRSGACLFVSSLCLCSGTDRDYSFTVLLQ